MGNLAEEDPESKLDDRDGFAAWASIIWSSTGAAVDTGESVNTDGGQGFSSLRFPRCLEREAENGDRIVASSGSTFKSFSPLSLHISSSSSRTA